jgi:hypothetical protein
MLVSILAPRQKSGRIKKKESRSISRILFLVAGDDGHLSIAAYPGVCPSAGHERGYLVLQYRILLYLALLQAGFIRLRCYHDLR